MSKRLGVIVWPAHIIFEGVNSVLDKLQRAGVTDVATEAKVMAPAASAAEGRREPPDDGRCGGARTIDRPLWGKKELFIKVQPSFEFNPKIYEGKMYRPNHSGELTKKYGSVITEFLSEAKRRGMGAYIQIQVCHVPSVDPNNSGAPEVNESTPLLPNGRPASNRIYNFSSISSEAVREYACSQMRDIATAYPMIDGFVLDRLEQSFYTLDDVFLDFGEAARSKAEEYGYPFEKMKEKALEIYEGISRIPGSVLSAIKTPEDMSEFLNDLFVREPMVPQILSFRTRLVESYCRKLRETADSIREGMQLIGTVYPPEMALFTGVDFSKISRYLDGIHLKMFTMHWSMIVQCWAEQLMQMNSDIREEDAVRFSSLLFGFEDRTQKTLKDYEYPAPDQPHIAGNNALVRKVREAEREVQGKAAVYSFIHTYGPLSDVRRRLEIGWKNGEGGMWINRYGYLSDEKIDILTDVVRNS